MVSTRNTTSHNEQPNHNDTSSPLKNPDNIARQLSFIASKLNALDAFAADVAVLKAQAALNRSNQGKSITLGSHHRDDDSESTDWYRNSTRRLFTKFQGSDPRGWILKAKKYFYYYETPDESKVEIASLYLEDEHLCNIKQTGTVQEYRQEFSKRVAQVHDWPDHCLLGVFISGLKEELKVDVRIHKPGNVFKALVDREVEANEIEYEEGINQQDMAEISFHAILGKTSGTTMKMAHHVQNINHSAFRSMFEREKLSRNNFSDWFRQLKLVLLVEKKMYVIEHPLPAAPAVDFAANMLAEWNAIYDAYNEVVCLKLELKSMFEKQAGVERFDLIQAFDACKQEEGKPAAAYALQMKGYVDQLERLSYVLPQDLTVGLILNCLTKDFARSVRNYNMHNMGKTIGKLHAILIKYEKGLSKKAETPQVMMIKGGKIYKYKKKSLKVKGKVKANGKGNDKQVYIPKPKNPKPSAKEHSTKDATCHHCKEEGHWKRNCLVYLAELLKKKKQVGSTSCLVSKNNVHYFIAIPSNGIYEIDMHDLVPNVNSIYNVITKRAKHNLDSTYLWHYRLAHISKMTRQSFLNRPKRETDLLGIIHTDGCEELVKRDTPNKLQQISVKCIFIGYPKETMGYYFYFPPKNKIIVVRYAEFFEKNLITQEVSRRAVDLEEIQDEDTSC
uniref:Zinc finger, CCHC-type n=1 Tax=Tanacetum cinerariifolium TaxID=118510 RepID=A0A6L2J9V9_TANCI|nr:zinc finger, CCHC-type [Tanacetum cinerariifolium]